MKSLKAKVIIFQKIDLSLGPLTDLLHEVQLQLDNPLLETNSRGDLRLLLIELTQMRQNLIKTKIDLSEGK